MKTEAEPKWSREDVQRVLYHVIKRYEQANMPWDGKKKSPKRFIFFGPRIPGLGGDSELLRSAIYDVAIPTLKDNNWWPEDG